MNMNEYETRKLILHSGINSWTACPRKSWLPIPGSTNQKRLAMALLVSECSECTMGQHHNDLFLCCACAALVWSSQLLRFGGTWDRFSKQLLNWSPFQSLMMLWMYWVCPTNSSCFQEGNPADGVFLMGKPHAATPIEAKFKKSRNYDLYIQLSLSLSILYKYIYYYIYIYYGNNI